MQPRILPRLLSTAELAERLGTHRSTVVRWLAAGRIPRPYRAGHGYVWPEPLAESIARSLRPAPGPVPDAAPGQS